MIRLLVLSLFAAGVVHAAECKCAVTEVKEDAKNEAVEMKCPVDAKDGCKGGYCSLDVKDEKTVEYQGRKVLFCCNGCIEKFNKSPDTYAEQVKAQWELSDSKKEEKK